MPTAAINSRAFSTADKSLFSPVFSAPGITLFLGALIGMAAGYYGGWRDDLLMRIAELFLALPWLYLLFALRAFLPLAVSPIEAFLLVVVVIGMVGWARPARLVRGVVLSVKERDYVRAARGFGASDFYLLRQHILPETASVLLTQAAILVPQFVLAEMTLSFSASASPNQCQVGAISWHPSSSTASWSPIGGCTCPPWQSSRSFSDTSVSRVHCSSAPARTRWKRRVAGTHREKRSPISPAPLLRFEPLPGLRLNYCADPRKATRNRSKQMQRKNCSLCQEKLAARADVSSSLSASEPKTLNPLTAADTPSREVIGAMQADLVHINRATQLTEPALAKSWKISADGLQYTLTLRQGLAFLRRPSSRC